MTDAGSKLVYLDSNALIYAVEGVPGTAGPAKKLIAFLRDRRGSMFTSEIALAEVWAPSKRQGAWPLPAKKRAYLDLLLWSSAVTLVPVARNILIRTADLRKMMPLKLPDAVHLVSAIESNCRFFVTGDSDFKKMPSGIERVTPDEKGVESLLQEIA
jgi:predicted nucleic acid-binding protein